MTVGRSACRELSSVAEQCVPIGLASLGARLLYLFPAPLSALVALSGPLLLLGSVVALFSTTIPADEIGDRGSHAPEEEDREDIPIGERVQIQENAHLASIRVA